MSKIEFNPAASKPKNEVLRWPTKCICNLCDCGSHSCQTFILDETSDGRSNKDSSSNKCEPHQVTKMDLSDEQQLDSVEERKSCLGRFNDERYLSSMASDLTRLKRSTPIDNGHDDDLLHVLVSRPEIAAKPRDNIVFEGDMDLKTTFETSYEALAKMRLDYWKKYQDQQYQLEQAAGKRGSQDEMLRSKQKQKQPSAIESSNSEANQQKDHPSSVSVVSTDRKQRLANYDPKTVDSRPLVSVDRTAFQIESPKRRSPKLAPEIESKNDKVVARHKRQANERESNGERGEAESGTETELGRQSKPLKAALPSRQVSSINATYIDPDLSPIIVYDANMNRLEKVGIRKRSKYRPSTSLMSGARGLFGDQKEEIVVQEARNMEKQQLGSSVASAGLPNIKSAKVDAWSQSPEPNSVLEKNESSLNARNLNNFKQPDNLTYTDHNLLIDSKRKLRGNINMVDHIREHEIVERKTPISPILSPNKEALSNITSDDGPTQLMRENLENLKLEAQLEEEAAVEEIQRVTSNTTTNTDQKERYNHHDHQQQNQQELQQQRHARVSSTQSDDPRNSKLQRTCQNQNFYLFENEYPGAQDNLGIGTNNLINGAKYARASTHSRHYNNLFRESPDFILTTGKFIEAETKRFVSPSPSNTVSNPTQQNNNRDSRQAKKDNQFRDDDDDDAVAKNNDVDGTNDTDSRSMEQQRALNNDSQMSYNPYNNSQNIIDNNSNFRQLDTRETNAGCRVRKLNEDYLYVGSQSGHKYFVEK